MTHDTLAKPIVSFSTLAKLMGPVTPSRQLALLRGHKFPTDGPRRSYQNAVRQAVSHLVSAAPLDPEAEHLRPYEQEALLALRGMGFAPPPETRAAWPAPRMPALTLGGVTISAFPDAEIAGPRGTGAVKFVFNKDPLPRRVGTMMAALLWHLRSTALAAEGTSPSYCLVCEPRVGAVYVPGTNPARQIQSATQACQIIAALWPTIAESASPR